MLDRDGREPASVPESTPAVTVPDSTGVARSASLSKPRQPVISESPTRVTGRSRYSGLSSDSDVEVIDVFHGPNADSDRSGGIGRMGSAGSLRRNGKPAR